MSTGAPRSRFALKGLSTFFLPIIFAVLVLVAPPSPARAALRCERFLVAADAAQPKRAIESIDDLRIGTYNVENLFLHLGHHEPVPGNPRAMRRMSKQRAKPVRKIEGMARAILDMNLDIVVLQEVENIEALEAVNKRYLGERYTPVLVEGNDPRGIDVAFLVKKDLPFEIENHSFRKETWVDPRLPQNRPTPLFSRDLPVLVVRAKGQPKGSAPLFIMIGTHFKSKRPFNDPNALQDDPESAVMRGAQVERAVEIIDRYRAEYGDDLPVIFAGDFNGAVAREPEFERLRSRSGLVDAFDASQVRRTARDRVTHMYWPDRTGPADSKQIDAVFVSRQLGDSVASAETYRYKDPQGRPWPMPREKRFRDMNPSDHWPIAVTLKFRKLLERLNYVLNAGKPAA